MNRSTRKHVLLVLAAGLVLPLAYFYAAPHDRWVLAALVSLNVIFWPLLFLAHLVHRVRFGARMTLEEIRREPDSRRLVQLLRYHLGWSAGKIAAELNRRGIDHDGLPWDEKAVQQIGKSARRVF